MPAGLLLVLCSACDLQGLDLGTPGTARAYVRACARGAEAAYCRAMLPVLQQTSGDVTVLLPNDGDHEIMAALQAYSGQSAATFGASSRGVAYARANIFAAPRLHTGVMHTLDGRAHRVACRQESPEICAVDGRIEGWNHLAGRQNTGGSVYALSQVGSSATGPAFLSF